MLCETDIDIDILRWKEVEGVINKEVTRNINKFKCFKSYYLI